MSHRPSLYTAYGFICPLDTISMFRYTTKYVFVICIILTAYFFLLILRSFILVLQDAFFKLLNPMDSVVQVCVVRFTVIIASLGRPAQKGQQKYCKES